MRRVHLVYGAVALALAVTLTLVPRGVLAQKAELPKLRLMPTEFPWSKSVSDLPGSGMQPGIETIYVVGDGQSAELYSMVFRIAPHTTIQPHSHPDSRSCFVLSGLWFFAYGTVRDEGQLKALPSGSLYTEPANQPHFAGTKDQGVTLECTAVGPAGTTMIGPGQSPSPNDDPQKKP